MMHIAAVPSACKDTIIRRHVGVHLHGRPDDKTGEHYKSVST
jgi:hypothetical protein